MRAAQVNFSRGELGPQLYGRFDVDAWQSACKQARNVVVLKFGGLTKRPGTRLVGEVLDDSEETRLVPFQFSLTQTYALEFGQGYMSPVTGGARVIEEEVAIVSISNANPAQVTMLYHGYEPGDFIYLSGIEGEMGDYLNGRVWPVVADTGTDTFTIDADTSGMDAFTAATGGITRTAEPTPPAPVPVPPPPAEEPPPDGYYGGGGDFGGGPGFPGTAIP